MTYRRSATTLRVPASRTFAQRMINATGACVVKNITLDGNREARGWPGGYAWEQSHCFFIQDGTLTMDNAHFKRSPGDGVCINRNVTATITDCSADADVFRGAVTVNGGESTITVTRFNAPDSLLDMEIVTPGTVSGDYGSDVTVTNSTFSEMHLEAYAGHTVEIIDSTVGPLGFYSSSRTGGSISFVGCDLTVGDEHFLSRHYWPFDVSFVDCTLRGQTLQIFPEVNDYQQVNGRMSFTRVVFIGDDVDGPAVYNYGSTGEHHGNVVHFEDCTYEGFESGYQLRSGFYALQTGLPPAPA